MDNESRSSCQPMRPPSPSLPITVLELTRGYYGIVRASREKRLDVVVFTNSAEVEGLLKSLREFGLGFGDLRKRCPGLVVAAHGPVTVVGEKRLEVKVDVVSSKFGSFDGDVDALNVTFASPRRTIAFHVPLLPNIPTESGHSLRGAPHSYEFPTNALFPINLNDFPVGIELEIWLKDMLRSCKLEELPNLVGMGPLNLLFDRRRRMREEQLEIDDRPPMNLFKNRISLNSAPLTQMTGGMLPIKLFVEASTHLSLEFLPKLCRSEPEKLLFQMRRVSKDASCVMLSGTVPLMSLYMRLSNLRKSDCKLVRLDSFFGIGPDRFAPALSRY
ncbi:hypothetical protein VNO78_03062 [Psophocarpus tetragonolobus]|uniref:Uncharacterized protein n=1 Tax=Psophocarpus tetragonolobus TaxID=3891 RepID=A0AAN9SZS4_PSOTE